MADGTILDVSSTLGLIAMGMLTVNILLGLLLSTNYNPVRRRPHRKINIFQLHNWTGYTALAVAFVHPVLLLFSHTAGFRALDLALPFWSPQQRNYNLLGALAFYLTAFVVVTSYLRPRLGNRIWKKLHYTAYAAAAVFFTHGILIDQNLKQQPPDLLDGEKLLVEGCAVLVIAGTILRVRYGKTKPTAS
jgi:sulfoxide reductase heme-binding subunit YedZ